MKNVFYYNLSRKGYALFKVMAICFGLFILASCNKGDVDPEENNGTLSATETIIVLSQNHESETAITFNWAFPQGGSNYILQFAIAENFTTPYNDAQGAGTQKSYTHGELREILVNELEKAPGSAHNIYVRVQSGSDFTNVLTLTVTPYEEEVETEFADLWVIGSATPGGWSWDAAGESQRMQYYVNNEDEVFITLNLSAGELKIGTVLHDWGAPFYRPAFAENQAQLAPLSHQQVQFSAGDPDHKWIVSDSEAGAYLITLNKTNLTISFERLD